MKIDLEKVKNIDFESPKIKAQFDKIEKENKRLIESSKIKDNSSLNLIYTV